VLLLPVPVAAAMSEYVWPAGHRGAVSLSYDDGLDSQLDLAVPALERHGFRGTFF
jgi:peptidoglycan/xylan/chitin deacetylase (PgdA/CDA1 family)